MTTFIEAELQLITLMVNEVKPECGTDECSNEARWSRRCEGCSDVTLACSECKARTDEWVAEIHAESGSVFCTHCHAPTPRLNWLPL